MNVLDMVEKQQLRTDLPVFKPGDTIKVHVKIKEGDKERIQIFEGVCIALKHGGNRATFHGAQNFLRPRRGAHLSRCIRALIDKVELVRSGRVRRAKLYYIRELRGKAARIREVKGKVKKRSLPANNGQAAFDSLDLFLSWRSGYSLCSSRGRNCGTGNYLLTYVPAFKVVILHNVFRAAVTGLGGIDILIGISELGTLIRSLQNP